MINDDFWQKAKLVNLSDEDFTLKQKEGEVKIGNFETGNSKNKLISTVVDNEFVFDDNQRNKYLATYIGEKDQIIGLKISQYNKSKEGLKLQKEINLKFKEADTLVNFLKFLLDANLGTLTSGKFILADSLHLDPELFSKLVSLSSDTKGKKALLKLFESGYLTVDLDIPDLIKKGLSHKKIEEKIKLLNEFEILIKNPEVKEVSEIQEFLKNHPWIFGPEYKNLDFRGAGFAGNPDGRLLRIDGLSDILEVKLPSEELLRADEKNRQFISPKLAEALGQLTGYLEFYYSAYSHERDDKTGEEILEDAFGKYYKPKGILLIGRRNKEMVNAKEQTISAEPKNMRRLLSYFHWVEVLTYDDLIERARNGLNNLIAK